MATAFVHTRDRNVTVGEFNQERRSVAIDVDSRPGVGDTIFIESYAAAISAIDAGKKYLKGTAKHEKRALDTDRFDAGDRSSVSVVDGDSPATA